MDVKLAQTAGFCMGVKRAVDKVLDIARSRNKKKIYTYGPLIHNPQTVDLLKKRGVIPVGSIDEIPAGERDSILVVRTHGISPEERRIIKERGIEILDATCPKVARVQAIIKKHVSRGYTIVIVGDDGHPEIAGLLGYASGRGVIVEKVADIDKIPPSDKIGIVAQTTQNSNFYAEIVRAIKERFPHAVVFDTICNSTEKRQKEVKDLAAEMDAVVIVGGRNSANTKRLAEISEHQGRPTFLIETAEELKNHPLGLFTRIGVSAGASTPNWIIDRVVNNIGSYRIKGDKKFKNILQLWLFLVRTDIYSAVGAGCLYLASAIIRKSDISPVYFLIAAFYVYAMHVLNRFMDKKAGIIGSLREETYLKHKTFFIAFAVAALLFALILAMTQGIKPFLLLFLISLAGILYHANLLPQRWQIRSLRELPGSKNLFMSLAWAMAAAVLPGFGERFSVSAGMIVAFIFTFAVVFIRSVISDITDMQDDRLVGRETIPVITGPERSLRVLKMVMALLLILLVFSYLAGWAPSAVFALFPCLFYLLICLKLCDRRAALSGMVLLGLLETNYIIAGMSAVLWLLLVGSGA